MNEERIATIARNLSAGIGVADARKLVNKANGRVDLVLRALRGVIWELAGEDEILRGDARIVEEMLAKVEKEAKKRLTSWQGRDKASRVSDRSRVAGVRVNTQQFENSYGKRPRGYGSWAFNIDGDEVFFSGNYAQAKAKAVAVARSRGVMEIDLLS